MKKSLLALAVAALASASIASTASATTVYDKDGTSLGFHGRVQSVFYSGKQSGVSNEEASINTSARFGFDLRSQITQGVSGFAMAEWEAANGNNQKDGGPNDHFTTRLMWAGVDFGQFGSVKIGKFEEAIKYSLFATDIFEDYGCLGYAGNDDRREGVVQYQWSGYGVNALLSYAFAKDNEHLDGYYQGQENVDIDYSVSAAIGYTSPDIVFGPIDVRAGVIYGKLADGNPNNHKNHKVSVTDGTNTLDSAIDTYLDKYSQFALGASWGKLNIGPYIGAQFSQRTIDFDYLASLSINGQAAAETGSDEMKITGYEFAVGYSFANGILVRTGYQYQKFEYSDLDVEAANIPVFALWNLNANFQVWAEARFDAGTDDDHNAEINAVGSLPGITADKFFLGLAGKNWRAVNGGNNAENVFSAGIRYNF